MNITQKGGRGEPRPGALGRMVSWLTWVRGQRQMLSIFHRETARSYLLNSAIQRAPTSR